MVLEDIKDSNQYYSISIAIKIRSLLECVDHLFIESTDGTKTGRDVEFLEMKKQHKDQKKSTSHKSFRKKDSQSRCYPRCMASSRVPPRRWSKVPESSKGDRRRMYRHYIEAPVRALCTL